MPIFRATWETENMDTGFKQGAIEETENLENFWKYQSAGEIKVGVHDWQIANI